MGLQLREALQHHEKLNRIITRRAERLGNFFEPAIDRAWQQRRQSRSIVSAEPLWKAIWSVLALLTSYCGTSGFA